MKKNFTLIICLFIFSQISYGQIVITEIMYNNVSVDSLEFIELHNPGSSAVDISGYYFSDGIEDTIVSATIEAGGYWVIADDSIAMRRAFNISTDEWDDGGVNNGGELVELRDANGAFVDSVRYDDGNGWPTLPDGNGPSLILCDPSTDNGDPANWASGTSSTGLIINGIEVLASPGAENNCMTITFPRYDIATVTTENSVGVADSSGRRCELQGIVVGINIGASRADVQFTIQDATGGIGVFDNDGNGTNNYTVTEGDEVVIQGIISQFRGLTQINPENLTVVSSGNTLLAPRVVTVADESTESELIRINGVHIVDDSEWGSGTTGYNVRVTTGSPDTIVMRIDDDTNLFGTSVPQGDFDVIGIGGQFGGTSAPFDDGYQIQPRYMADIMSTTVSTNDPELGKEIELYPNPTDGILTLNLTTRVDQVEIFNQLGMMIQSYQNLEGQHQLNLQNLNSGLFFIRFIKDDLQWVEKITRK